MYAIYGNIYHQFTPNVSIYTIHGSYGYGNFMAENRETSKSTEKKKHEILELIWLFSEKST